MSHREFGRVRVGVGDGETGWVRMFHREVGRVKVGVGDGETGWGRVLHRDVGRVRMGGVMVRQSEGGCCIVMFVV